MIFDGPLLRQTQSYTHIYAALDIKYTIHNKKFYIINNKKITMNTQS